MFKISNNLKIIFTLVGVLLVLLVLSLAIYGVFLINLQPWDDSTNNTFREDRYAFRWIYYSITHQYDKGIKYFDGNIARKNHVASAYVAKAMLESDFYYYRNSLRDYDVALKADPNYVVCYLGRSRVKEDIADFELNKQYNYKGAHKYYLSALADAKTFLKKYPADEKGLMVHKRILEKSRKKPKTEAEAIKEYMPVITKIIENNWHPDMNIKKGVEKVRIVLVFTMSRNGNVSDIKVVKSSGDSKKDLEAIKAIERSTPFPSLPKEYKGDSVDINFTLDQNIFNNK